MCICQTIFFCYFQTKNHSGTFLKSALIIFIYFGHFEMYSDFYIYFHKIDKCKIFFENIRNGCYNCFHIISSCTFFSFLRKQDCKALQS